MDKQQFKTTINCQNCIRAVTGFLADVDGIDHWEVAIDHPDKVLTVRGPATKKAIIDAIEEAGFDITPLPKQNTDPGTEAT